MGILKKIIKILGVCLLFIIFFLILTMLGNAPKRENISWGVTFSQKYAMDLDLDWQETFLAIIDDLEVQKIRVPVYWDFIQPSEGVYDFDDLDWILDHAVENNLEIIPVIGMRVPRWPECHLPVWAESLEKNKQQEHLLGLIEEIVLRYRENETIIYWQVENEPFLTTFGECPWADTSFLKEEVELVRNLDPDTPILISESGELSTWFRGARIADTVGTSIYRKNWWHAVGGGYYSYPITPVHYYRKASVIDRFFDKQVICVELQMEPWGPAPTFVISLEEQKISMDIDRFEDNINYAKRTGLGEFYLWGVEWWYWMMVENENDEFWERAKELFK